MKDKYDRWIADAPRWLEGLPGSLVRAGGDDLLVGYGDIALAFPLRQPHENTFDFPIIDFLPPWGKSSLPEEAGGSGFVPEGAQLLEGDNTRSQH